MNGPQQTAVSRKELWQKYGNGLCHTKISEEYSCDAATDLEHDSAVIGTATYSLIDTIVNFWTPPFIGEGVRKKITQGGP